MYHQQHLVCMVGEEDNKESQDNDTEAQDEGQMIPPEDLIGRTFLIDQEDGTRLRVQISKAIDEGKWTSDP